MNTHKMVFVFERNKAKRLLSFSRTCSFILIFLKNYFMCMMSVLSIGMYVYTTDMPGTYGGQRRASTCPRIGVIDG